jgi:hypothetical protein
VAVGTFIALPCNIAFWALDEPALNDAIAVVLIGSSVIGLGLAIRTQTRSFGLGLLLSAGVTCAVCLLGFILYIANRVS